MCAKALLRYNCDYKHFYAIISTAVKNPKKVALRTPAL